MQDLPEILTVALHREAEKSNRLSFMNKSFNMQCNLTKFSTLVNEQLHLVHLGHLV